MKRLLILLLLCFSATYVGAAEHAKELPIKAFFEKPIIDGVRISPDGKHLVARATVNGSKNIIILERKTNKQVYFFNFSDEKDEVGSFGWLNNERIFATMSTKVGPLERTSETGYLFAANIDGKKKIKLLPHRKDVPRRFSIIDNLDDDPEHILLQMGKVSSSQSEVVQLNVYSGKQKTIQKGMYSRSRFSIDHDAKVRILTSADDAYEFISVFYRNTEEDEWQEIDKRDREESTFNVITFTPDNNQFYFYENSEKRKAGIYLFDPKTKSATLVHAIVGDQDIQSYIIDEKADQLIGVIREKGKLVKEYFDGFSEIVAQHKMLDNAFPDEHVRILNYTKTFDKALIVSQSDKNPGKFYLFDKNEGNITFLMSIRPLLPTNEMSERRPFSFAARDGLEIRGLITLPKGKEKNLPLVVLVHGGPYGVADSWTFDTESQFLANNGYAVLQVNYRGSGGRGLSFEYDNYRKMGKEMQDDLTDATLWAVQEGYADKARMCIYGASYGGYASLMGVVKEPDLYKCAIGYAGVYDIDVQRTDSDTRDSDGGRQFLEDAWNAYDKDFVKERSSAYHVDRIKAALLIVHGTADKRTPIGNYKVLANALEKINYPFEKMIKDDEGHGFYTEENQIEMYTKLLEFLKKHIGN